MVKWKSPFLEMENHWPYMQVQHQPSLGQLPLVNYSWDSHSPPDSHPFGQLPHFSHLLVGADHGLGTCLCAALAPVTLAYNISKVGNMAGLAAT